MSTPTRGGPLLYSPPDEVLDLAPAWGQASCWAAAVFGHVARLQPEVESRLAAARAELLGAGPYAAAHLREGDNALHAEQYGGRVYTNKPVVTAEQLGRLLAAAEQPRQVYLATDAADAEAAASRLASAFPLPAPAVRTLPRFRTPHGSHNVAYATAMLGSAGQKLLLPYKTLSTYVGRDRPPLAPPAQVMWEALEDPPRASAALEGVQACRSSERRAAASGTMLLRGRASGGPGARHPDVR